MLGPTGWRLLAVLAPGAGYDVEIPIGPVVEHDGPRITVVQDLRAPVRNPGILEIFGNFRGVFDVHPAPRPSSGVGILETNRLSRPYLARPVLVRRVRAAAEIGVPVVVGRPKNPPPLGVIIDMSIA